MKWLIEEILYWYRYARLQYTFWWINRQLRKAEKRKALFKVGDSVDYDSRMAYKIRGTIRKVGKEKCLVEGLFMNSKFSQWIDKMNLTKIEELNQ